MPSGEPGRLRRVERALRAAAREGNRLIAGSTASIDVADTELRAALTTALSGMGARLRGPGDAVDFSFVDRVDASRAADASGGDGPAVPGGGLPRLIVGLDGSVRSPRGSDPDARIAWAAAGMPATAVLAEHLRAAAQDPGPRIGVSLVLEPKTAAFARLLADTGCAVAVFSAVSETDPEIAAALASDGRIAVFAPLAPVDVDAAPAIDAAHAAAILDWGPEYLIDDGAHLVRLAHTERRSALAGLRGAAEETTSGVRPVREMAELGELRIPVIAVNDARTKLEFDNLIGTGQSCVLAIADLLDTGDAAATGGVAGSRWAVIGYGPVGRGVARFARALGAAVTVVERDPVRALSALHDGLEARPGSEALPLADVVVSATGIWHTLDAPALSALAAGTVVAVAGGIDDEIALDALRAAGWERRPVRAHVEDWIAPRDDAPDAAVPDRGARAAVERRIRVLAGGGGVNYTAAEGNPIEVMDLSFATQVSALIRLMRDAPAPGVVLLSQDDERAVAQAALAARGGGRDPAPDSTRAGGAAQAWTVHRYRQPQPPETP